ncbi:MAG: XdhC family protein [Candidatus Bipolaricaulota bacterium]|nr:XdhC family protein [Candidatus Bipolaricaulota bacterium]MDW8126827.1 XdhC family protein [Candidatus Bipolaricaulota bacterium]
MGKAIFQRAVEAIEKGEPAVLVTVVAVEGAAPREAGAKMLVFPDGRVEGTIGGGALEHHAIHTALALLQRGEKTLLETRNLRDLGMLCGGQTTLFYEVLELPPVLLIFGAGHVGLTLARLAREATPWRIVICDDRIEKLSSLPVGLEGLHLPGYQRVPTFPGRIYGVVATESHETDFLVVAELLRQDPGPSYLGVLGSRAKAEEIRARLLAAGLPKEKVEEVRCPVGLPLGGKDPGAVAVSILAELLAFHHGRLKSFGTS